MSPFLLDGGRVRMGVMYPTHPCPEPVEGLYIHVS